MVRPNLSNLRLEDCCLQALRQIRGEFERAGLLQDVLAIAPFARALEMRPVQVATRAAQVVISVASGDWDRLREVTGRAAFGIARAHCRTWSTTEWTRHGFGTSPLGQFWEAMVESYS